MGKWKNKASEILLVVCALLFFSSIAMPIADAQIPILGSEKLDLPEVTTPPVTDFEGDGALFSNNPSMRILLYLVDRILGVVLLFLQVGVVIFIVIEGSQIMGNMEGKDMIKEKRMSLLYAVIGLVFLSLSGEVVRVFNPVNVATTGEANLFLSGEGGFMGIVDSVLNLVKYSLWAVCVVMIVNIGYKMITSQEKEISAQKKNLMWTAIGLFIVQIADLVVAPFASETQNKVEAGNQLLGNITGVLLSVLGPVALFFVTLAAFYFLTANGDEARIGKAKKILIGTVIAIVISFSAYTLVSEILRYAPTFTG